jgi:hypothetical protein
MASTASVERYSAILSGQSAENANDTTAVGEQQANVGGEGKKASEEEIIKIALEDVTEIQDQLLNNSSDPDNAVVQTNRLRLHPRRKVARKRFGEFSILVRRKVRYANGQETPQGTQLEIQSPRLQEIFRTRFEGRAGNVDLGTSPIKIPSPYYLLFYQRKEIEDYVQQHLEPVETNNEMQLVVEFIKENKDLQAAIVDYERLFPLGLITFNILWTIYPPREIVVFCEDEVQECYYCRQVYPFTSEGVPGFTIEVEGIAFDGKRTGRVSRVFRIMFFQGVKEITSLSIFPLTKYGKNDGLYQRLAGRRLRFEELVKPGNERMHMHMQYQGPVWIQDPKSDRTNLITDFTVSPFLSAPQTTAMSLTLTPGERTSNHRL